MNWRQRWIESELTHQREVRGLDREALALQAKEYERRLDGLNHAHELAEEKAHTYLSIDKYDSDVKAREMARDLATVNARSEMMAGFAGLKQEITVVQALVGALNTDVSNKRAEGQGTTKVVAMIFAAGGFVAAMVGVIAYLAR